MSWAIPAAIAGGQVLSSMIGSKSASKASAAASAEAGALRQQALAELSGLEPMELASLGYDPEMMQYIQGAQPIPYAPPEAIQGEMVAPPTEGRDEQMKVLQELSQLTEQGLSSQDAYNFMKNRRMAETSARGQEEAIIANYQQRGMSGTGLEAALRMMASQGGSERLSESQAMQSAENAKIKMAASQARGNLAGNIRGQDIGVAQSNADILNQLAWHNSQRAREIENKNIDMQNLAAQQGISEQRALQSTNVGTQNQAQLMNRQQEMAKQEARQQSVHDIAKTKAGALTGGIPDIYAGGAANAANARQMWNTIGGAVGTGGQMYMTQQSADKASAEREKDRQAYGYGNLRPM